MTPDAQDEGDDHVEYATLEEDEDVGTRFRMHIIDAVGKEHPDGRAGVHPGHGRPQGGVVGRPSTGTAELHVPAC